MSGQVSSSRISPPSQRPSKAVTMETITPRPNLGAPSIDTWLGHQPSDPPTSALSHPSAGGRPPPPRRSLAMSEAPSEQGTDRRRDASKGTLTGRGTAHSVMPTEVTNLLRELRLEQERLRDQLAAHAGAMERVQREADAAKHERDRAQEELRRARAALHQPPT